MRICLFLSCFLLMAAILYSVFIYSYIRLTRGNLLDDVCHKDDVNCRYPDISSLGQLSHGECQQDNILRRIREISLLECAKECLLTSQCHGINYRKSWKLCDTLNKTNTPMTEERGCLYSQIESWPKTLAGNCAEHMCKPGEKCVYGNEHVTCLSAYCKDLPNTDNITIVEKFGLYRNLGSYSKVKCNEGFKKTEGIPYIACNKTGGWERQFKCKQYKYKDCDSLRLNGTRTGVYTIYPEEFPNGINVYCDMETDGKGWIVIQNRFNGSEDFFRTWIEYKVGFGTLHGEFWLGNDKIHKLTSTDKYKLRLDVQDVEGDTRYEEQSTFIVAGEDDNYRLTVGGYSGSAVLEGKCTLKYNNQMIFQTKDHDNTKGFSGGGCAVDRHCGFWFKLCTWANPNGKWLPGGRSWLANYYYDWKSDEGMSKVSMKIRKK